MTDIISKAGRIIVNKYFKGAVITFVVAGVIYLAFIVDWTH